MPLYAYHPKSVLHVCNECLFCDSDRYQRLSDKEKITEEHQLIINILDKYRILTYPMISRLTSVDEDILKPSLKQLEEYGIIIRQYYQYEVEGENRRTPVFFCLSPDLPFATENASECTWKWSTELRIDEAMGILNFNLFHLILRGEVPHRAIQARVNYKVNGIIADGYYKLKGKKFFGGYSHCYVLSTVDFSDRNKDAVKRICRIWEHYLGKDEKMPWVVVICENSIQAIHIQENFSEADIEDRGLYFIFAGELEYGENPFQILQSVRREGGAILTDNFVVDNWY